MRILPPSPSVLLPLQLLLLVAVLVVGATTSANAMASYTYLKTDGKDEVCYAVDVRLLSHEPVYVDIKFEAGGITPGSLFVFTNVYHMTQEGSSNDGEGAKSLMHTRSEKPLMSEKQRALTDTTVFEATVSGIYDVCFTASLPEEESLRRRSGLAMYDEASQIRLTAEIVTESRHVGEYTPSAGVDSRSHSSGGGRHQERTLEGATARGKLGGSGVTAAIRSSDKTKHHDDMIERLQEYNNWTERLRARVTQSDQFIGALTERQAGFEHTVKSTYFRVTAMTVSNAVLIVVAALLMVTHLKGYLKRKKLV